MGIRMLHRRTAPARTQAQVHADKVPSFTRPPVPAHAAAASTARIPVDLAILLRRARAGVPGRLARRGGDAVVSGRRRWAEMALGHLALALTLLPRSRPLPTMTVFVAPAGTVSGRSEDRPPADHRTPEPDATA
ncbi:hypothetical protein [Streptomyces sp. NPDC005374]|uniref:hypothetical protein n=1 Tax=Streptomyces sp. NPDC005374 TaxID=3364713 RepID=UPI00368C0444